MARIKLEFVKIKVNKDGDGAFDGAGDIYYEFAVDTEIVAALPASGSVKANDGQSVLMNKTYEFTRKPGETFSITGYVADADSLGSGKDDMTPELYTTYSSRARWGAGDYDVRLRGSKLDVNVVYKITLLAA